MNESQSRKIAERANWVRPMLDLRQQLAGPRWSAILFTSAGAFIVAGVASEQLLPRGYSWVGPLVVGLAVAIIGMRLLWMRCMRFRDARAKMVCPRCRYILREDGPDSWATCDDTVRVCSECSYAIADDVYAAATLPSVRRHASRVVNTSSGVIVGMVILIPLNLGGAMLLLFAPRPSEGLGARVLSLGVVQLIAVVLLSFLVSRRDRAVKRLVASWSRQPFCTKCDAALPDGARELSLAVCGECGRRVSPPAALAEARRAAIR